VLLYEPDRERIRALGLPIVRLEQPGEADQMEVLQLLGTRRDDQGLRICTAFTGSVGQACACGIYADRPDLCRKFEAGDTLCRAARQKAGLPV
jgi:Fe-S-cluster containining protein